MPMKVVKVAMDDRLLKAVGRLAKARRTTRAALIREACQWYLQKLEEEELDRKYIEGYHRKPESSAIGRVGAKLAQEVWPKENWDAEWRDTENPDDGSATR